MSGPAFTEREQKLLIAACQAFEGDPKLDMDKFASLTGLAKGSARNAWAALRKKIYTTDATTPGTPGTPILGKPPKNTKSSTKKRAATIDLPVRDDNEEDDEEDEASPSKKVKTTAKAATVKGKGKGKGKAKAKAKEESEDDEDTWVPLKQVKKEEGVEDDDDEDAV